MVEKAGWGGRRAGSGRLADLRELDLLLIGARAERLSLRWAKRQAQAKHRARTAAIPAPPTKNDVAVHERAQWLQSYEAEYHSDDVEGELRSLAEAEGRPYLGRGLSMQYRQVRGSRECVKRRVARWASRRFGLVVRPSRVDRCWKMYRSLFDDNLDC